MDEEKNCAPLSASPGVGPPQIPTWWAKEIQRSLRGESLRVSCSGHRCFFALLDAGVFVSAGLQLWGELRVQGKRQDRAGVRMHLETEALPAGTQVLFQIPATWATFF